MCLRVVLEDREDIKVMVKVINSTLLLHSPLQKLESRSKNLNKKKADIESK